VIIYATLTGDARGVAGMRAATRASGNNPRAFHARRGAKTPSRPRRIFDAKRMQNHAMKALQGGFG